MNPSPPQSDRSLVISAAALLGHHLKEKSFTSLLPATKPSEESSEKGE
jgi:hypothetical protein